MGLFRFTATWIDRRPGFGHLRFGYLKGAAHEIYFDVIAAATRSGPLVATAPMKIGRQRQQYDQRGMQRARSREVRLKTLLFRIGEGVGHDSCRFLLRFIAIGQRLSHDADVVDAGLPQRIDHRSKNAEGNRFITAQENRILLFAQLEFTFSPNREYDGSPPGIDLLLYQG